MTLRQKKLAKNIGNSRTLKEALLKSGYAASTADQQSTITKSKTFEELLEQHLPDDKIFLVHEEGLGALKIHGTNDNFIEIIDYPTRLKAAELAYKVKGRLKDNVKHEGEITMQVEIVRHKVNENTI